MYVSYNILVLGTLNIHKYDFVRRYITAVRNTRYMGRQLANFIQFLNGNGFPASSVHIVGFSLGAEAAGFAGKYLRSRGLLVGRITGEK